MQDCILVSAIFGDLHEYMWFVAETMTLTNLWDWFCEVFHLEDLGLLYQPSKISFLDHQGDYITITTDEELRNAPKFSKSSKLVKIKLEFPLTPLLSSCISVNQNYDISTTDHPLKDNSSHSSLQSIGDEEEENADMLSVVDSFDALDSQADPPHSMDGNLDSDSQNIDPNDIMCEGSQEEPSQNLKPKLRRYSIPKFQKNEESKTLLNTLSIGVDFLSETLLSDELAACFLDFPFQLNFCFITQSLLIIALMFGIFQPIIPISLVLITIWQLFKINTTMTTLRAKSEVLEAAVELESDALRIYRRGLRMLKQKSRSPKQQKNQKQQKDGNLDSGGELIQEQKMELVDS